jgi:hypothetical protein
VSKRPFTVYAAAGLEALEGAAAIVGGLVVAWQIVIGEAVDPASAVALTVVALAGGAGMIACGRGLLNGASWSRSPTVVTQLFALPVAWALWQSGQYAFAVPLGLVAVLALVMTLSPPSTAWLVETAGEDDDEAAGKKSS